MQVFAGEPWYQHAMGDHADAPAAGGVWDRGHRSLTIGLILTVSMGAFEALAVATILPAAVADIGGLELYGWVFSGFMLANLVGISVGGSAADRVGVGRPYVAGSVLFAAGLLGAGCAASMPIVVVSRVAQGFGAGAISSVAYVAVARAYGPEARPRMLAMLASAWVVPGLIGPAVAGSVADHVGWRWVFLGLAPYTAAAASLTVPALHRLARTAPLADKKAPTLAALRLALGTGAALFGVTLKSIPLAAALIGLGATLAVPALRHLVPRGTLRARPGLPAAIATLGLLNFAFFGAEAFLPLTLTALHGQSTTMAGIALTAATLSWTSGAWIQERLVQHRSRRAVVSVGLFLTLCGIGGIATLDLPGVPALIAIPTWGIAGLGIGLAYTTLTLVILDVAPAGDEGAASAAMQLVAVLGTALGTGLGGAAVALTTTAGRSPRSGIALVNAATMLAAGVAIAAARGLPGRAARNSSEIAVLG